MAGRLALVSGASAGIGAEIARELAVRGNDLILVARRAAALETLATELSGAHGVTCEVFAADLSEPDGVAAVAGQIAEHKPVTVVNNAGVGSYGLFQELPLEDELREIRLNVEALVALSHATLQALVPRRSGGLLNLASTASFQPGPRNATYSATKAFVRSFTEAIHEEVLPWGIHVTALCPGFTPTEFQEQAGMKRAGVPAYMWTSAREVAEAGLNALERNQAVCIPGFVNKLGAQGVRLAPRSVARKMAGQVLKDM